RRRAERWSADRGAGERRLRVDDQSSARIHECQRHDGEKVRRGYFSAGREGDFFMKEVVVLVAVALLGIAPAYADENGPGDQPTPMLETPTDGAPPAENAASYDSSYKSGMRLRGSEENTPEADARPGEYYFKIGARAFQKNDSKFAIQMYEVAASWAYKPAAYNLGVMYARGQGTPVDFPRALAWMALAAERG